MTTTSPPRRVPARARPARLLGLAVGLAVAVLAGTGTAAEAAFPPPTGVVPADWTTLVDDTRTIAIAVPSGWVQTDTVPAQNADGTPRPWISATPNHGLFLPPEGVADTYSVPGVIYVAVAPADTAATLASSEYHGLCTAQPLQTFSGATFTGHLQMFAACGGTPTYIVQVAAQPADGSFLAILLIQLTGLPDDAATLNGLLLSFGRHVEPTA